MIRNGKIARLPAALRQELNQRLFEGETGRQLVLWCNGVPKIQALMKENKQRIRRILGIGEGYDGSKNPELTRPPAAQNRGQSASIGLNRSKSE